MLSILAGISYVGYNRDIELTYVYNGRLRMNRNVQKKEEKVRIDV